MGALDGLGANPAPVSSSEIDHSSDISNPVFLSDADSSSSTPGLSGRALSSLENGGAREGDDIRVQTVPIPEGTSLPRKALTLLGTLHVGDRFVSSGQNSAATVAARPGSPRPTDSISVHAEGQNENRPSADSAPSNDSPSVTSPEENSSSFFDWGGTSVEEEEERRRRERQQAVQAHYASLSQPSSYGVASTRPPQIDSSPVSSTRTPPVTSRYVLDAHDVHRMGGSPSRVQISNSQTGEVLRNVNLPQGNSRTVVDLPSGNYSFTAIAGERSAGSSNPDRLDNFNVDVYQTNSLHSS